jgi:hypothetical protein
MTEELPRTSVPAGLFGVLQFELVPVTKLEFAAPDDATRSALEDPKELALTIPIKGKHLNFPNGTKCQLWWLVKKGTEVSNEGPLDATIAVDSDTGFHLTVNGAAPKLDLIRHKVVGKGALGYRVVPDFPHAVPAEFAPGDLTFDIPFGVEFQKPSPLLIGSKVVFKPHFSGIFDKAEVRLEIAENDEGEVSGAPSAASAGFSSWKGNSRDPYTWVIGFTDTSFSRFTFAETNELGDFEFVWRLTASSDGGRTFTTLVENKTDFVGVKKPRLEQFKLHYEDGLLEDEVVAQGKIANFAPGTHVQLDVALVGHDQIQHDPAPDWHKSAHSGQLADDGTFAIPLVTKWIGMRVAIPDPHKTFGILSFPASLVEQSATTHTLWPILTSLAADDAVHPGFKGNDVCFGPEAEWFCSEEVANLVKTPAQLLDDDLVKRVLYPGGTVDAATHEKLKAIVAGNATVKKGSCEKGVARALQRALVYLGYPTTSAGQYDIGDDFGAGANFGWALFLRERAQQHLTDEAGHPIGDKTLIFESANYQQTPAKVASFPVVPVDKLRFDDLLRHIDATRRSKAVYLADCVKAIANLDQIDARKYLNAAGVVQRFRTMVLDAAKYAGTKGVTIEPIWIASFILTETQGVPRPKYEHHELYRRYAGTVAGGLRSGETLVNIVECRFRATSFGLGQVMGFNYSASSVSDLYKMDEPGQVNMVADYLVGVAKTYGSVKVLLTKQDVASAQDPGLNKLVEAYNGGGYATHNYHGIFFANFKEVKKVW